MLNIEQQISSLKPLLAQLLGARDDIERLSILNALTSVQQGFADSPILQKYQSRLDKEAELALKSILAIGQGPLVFHGIEDQPDPLQSLNDVMKTLLDVERFYKPLGGIVGYHLKVLELIVMKSAPCSAVNHLGFLHPPGTDISKETTEVRQAVRKGIESLPYTADIYPVGGAGDRLSLKDEKTGQPLPAAQLLFGGRTLLEGLMRDLQAREFLHFKLFGKQVDTPVAMMTSHEKDNENRIKSICRQAGWFGRDPNHFFFFTQPLVPVITKEGNWALHSPMKLQLKPGGHGVMWKLALDQGIIDKLLIQGRRKALVRQINNPVAGTDYALLAFAGLGFQGDKHFGFASCERLLKSPEGMNVLIERERSSGYDYILTNIEYTDFALRGIEDMPAENQIRYSAYPSNTNILFADLEKVREIAEKYPTPGMLINMKTTVRCLGRGGHYKEVEAGRLETTMQNIADYIVDHFEERPPMSHLSNRLSTFITYNVRRKTISVTKSSYESGKHLSGTPEGCFYEMLENHRELLMKHCRIHVPALGTEEKLIHEGPSFIFFHHPALGPPYSIIGQKIRGGRWESGAELQLEISEIQIKNLNLDGSLLIAAKNIMGHLDSAEKVVYSDQAGKCILKNVTVQNEGIDREAENLYWKNQIARKECLSISIEGNGEFYAENVTFRGTNSYVVPAGKRMVAVQLPSGVQTVLEALDEQPKCWRYAFDEENRIQLLWD